jgi:CheY-like chemotaxis protein
LSRPVISRWGTRVARVLIVDDNHALALTLAECVETQGHQVTIASNGKEAVECFRETEFDIAFMDGRMPVMNGIDSASTKFARCGQQRASCS